MVHSFTHMNQQRQKLFFVTFKWIKLESHSWSHMKAHSYYIMKTTNFLKIHWDKAGLWEFIYVFPFMGKVVIFSQSLHHTYPVLKPQYPTKWEK